MLGKGGAEQCAPKKRAILACWAAGTGMFLLASATLLAVGLLAVPGLSLPVEHASTQIIIDTDAGTDDAMALFMALGYEKNQPSRVKVVAITCVHGNTRVDNVVVNVLKVLQTTGRLDVPVYRGAPQSLLLTPPSDNYFGTDGFGDVFYPNAPKPADYVSSEHAVNALIKLVTASPGEITIVCLGPLTNIALAVRLDPLFLDKVKQVIILGGSVEGVGNIVPGIEFNFYMDPDADFIVLNSTDTRVSTAISPIQMMPWETVLKRINISMEWRTKVLGAITTSSMALLNQAESQHLKGEYWYSSDTFAMAMALNPDLITSQTLYHANVETQGTKSRGAVFVDYDNSTDSPKNVRVVQNLDVEELKVFILQNFP